MPLVFGFERGSAVADANQTPLADEVVRSVARRRFVSIRVEGHLDPCHEEPASLAEARATAVRDLLVSRGADAASLTVIGYTSNGPRMHHSCPASESSAPARRAEISVLFCAASSAVE